MRAATEWFRYKTDGIYPTEKPNIGEWVLWSVVTKHGREYYGGILMTDGTIMIDSRSLQFNPDEKTYWARVVKVWEYENA
jgi:hypothetical protein